MKSQFYHIFILCNNSFEFDIVIIQNLATPTCIISNKTFWETNSVDDTKFVDIANVATTV